MPFDREQAVRSYSGKVYEVDRIKFTVAWLLLWLHMTFCDRLRKHNSLFEDVEKFRNKVMHCC